MTYRVWLGDEGDWGEMERNGEFYDADTLDAMITKISGDLYGTYKTGMTFDELADELDANGYTLEQR